MERTWNRQSVPKRWHIKFRRRGITQKKTYNIQNTAKVLNQEKVLLLTIHPIISNNLWLTPPALGTDGFHSEGNYFTFIDNFHRFWMDLH